MSLAERDGVVSRPTVRVLDDANTVATAAAMMIAGHVAGSERPVIGLATGRTPLAIYARLVAAARDGRVDFSRTTSFNLDEYRGLDPEHPASFAAYMRRNLFDHVAMGATHMPAGLGNAEAEASAYEAAIARAGGIGLQLLGIGRNGHIAFNEPGARFDSRTRVVRLAEETRAANAPDFPEGETVPGEAMTMGIGTILEAKRILLVATGGAKRTALARAVAGPPDATCPASALLLHPHVTILCDREAAADLG